MLKKYFQKFNKLHTKLTTGFTLIETLVAISIFSLSIMTSMSVLGGGISSTNHAKLKTIASYLAQEGIESVRNMRDSYFLQNGLNGWNDFKVRVDVCTSSSPCAFDNSLPSTDSGFVFGCSSPCQLFLDNGAYTNSVGTPSVFSREIWFALGLDEVEVNSTVSWKEGSISKRLTFKERLTNWIE